MLNKILKVLLVLILLSAAYFIYLGATNKSDEVVSEVVIDASADKVYRYFTDPELSKEWLPGFVSATQMQGDGVEEGAVFELIFKEGKREFVMTETFVSVVENEHIAFNLDDKMMTGLVDIKLAAEGESTKVTETHNYSARNFVGRGMMGLMKGAINKSKQKMYEDLKGVVESGKGWVEPEPPSEEADTTAEEAASIQEDA